MSPSSNHRSAHWLGCFVIMCAISLFGSTASAGAVNGSYFELAAGSAIDLSAEGTLDWIKFGNGENGTNSFLNATKIGNPVFLAGSLALLGTPPDGFDVDYLTFTGEGNLNFTWDNGNFGMYNDPGPVDTLVTETLSPAANSYPLGLGMTFDALAAANPRVLNVYVQGFNSDMLITATMSGGGSDSVVVSPTQLGNSDPNNDYSFGYYQITYSGAGETLSVSVQTQSPVTDGLQNAFPNAGLFAATVVEVPEPSTMALGTFGLIALAVVAGVFRRGHPRYEEGKMNCYTTVATRSRQSRCIVAGALLCLLTAGSARAAVIYNNGNPLLAPVVAQGASFADTSNFSFSEAADDFSLGADLNTIRDIHWWGVYGTGIANPPADSFTISVYNDSAGAPGTLNSSVIINSLARTATASTITGLTMYAYDAVIADLTLPAATTFWLGISNNSGSNNWAWVNSQNSGGNARQFSTINGTWGVTNKELAFNLTNDVVPEPSTLALACGGFIAIGLAATYRARHR